MSTNPMKKGYGAANTGHLFGEYPYQGNAYDDPRDKERVNYCLILEIKGRT